MEEDVLFGPCLPPFGDCADRFVLSGYSGVKRTGYKGWHTLDIFPYREDGLRAVEESIAWIKSLYELLNRIGHQRIEKIIEEGDATQASEILRMSILSLGQNP